MSSARCTPSSPCWPPWPTPWPPPRHGRRGRPTAFGFAYAAGFLIAGPLSDRYGPRTVITGGLVGATATTLAVSAAPSLTWAVALRIAQGLTAATFAPSAFSYIAGHLAPHRRGIALTCVTSGMLASAVLMQIGAQIVAAGLGWRMVFVLGAALMALSLWPVRHILRPTAAQDSGPSLLQAFVAVPRLLRKPRLVALYLATATVMASFVAVYTAVVVAGPLGVAGDNAALLALRASALPALVAVPLLTPALHRLAAPVRVVLAMLVAAGAVAAGAPRWAAMSASSRWCCWCSWRRWRRPLPPSSRSFTPWRPTPGARASPSTPAACSSAPAWAPNWPVPFPSRASAASSALSRYYWPWARCSPCLP
ncbi:MFS transporter [Streptomyces phaeochromogenes]|uniref:MFS transporter n=1 Tax=Streptomyces phaeochromogenes TaxID=1923 RepID=UPI0033DB57B3